MAFLIAVLALAVVGIAVAWWWSGRIRASERNARSAAQRADVEARIMKQYRPSGPPNS